MFKGTEENTSESATFLRVVMKSQGKMGKHGSPLALIALGPNNVKLVPLRDVYVRSFPSANDRPDPLNTFETMAGDWELNQSQGGLLTRQKVPHILWFHASFVCVANSCTAHTRRLEVLCRRNRQTGTTRRARKTRIVRLMHRRTPTHTRRRPRVAIALA